MAGSVGLKWGRAGDIIPPSEIDTAQVVSNAFAGNGFELSYIDIQKYRSVLKFKKAECEIEALVNDGKYYNEAIANDLGVSTKNRINLFRGQVYGSKPPRFWPVATIYIEKLKTYVGLTGYAYPLLTMSTDQASCLSAIVNIGDIKVPYTNRQPML